MGEAVAHTRLGSEMDDALEVVLDEGGVEDDLIRDIGVDKGPVALRSSSYVIQDRKPRFLEAGVVVVIYGIVADDFIAALNQTLCDMKADEAGRPRNENFH